MKVKWKQFAQRRKINLEMFESMSYEDYADWCNFRKVEPISKESYDGVQNLLAPHKEKEIKEVMIAKEPVLSVLKEPVVDVDFTVVTISTSKFDEKQLKKMSKRGLIKICREHDLPLEKNETKNQLIEKLLFLNNT